MTASGWAPSGQRRIGMAIFLGLGVFCVTGPSWGSERSTKAGGYTIQNWQVEEGLPQISVTSIAQTPDGYLWLGTFNGLARFDGVRFTVFDEGNTPALGSSRILRLAVDNEGALWIVTTTGRVVRRAAGRFTAVIHEEASLAAGGVSFLHDPDGRLLLLDSNRRLRWVRKEQLPPLDPPDRLQQGEEPCLLIDQGGLGWVAWQGRLGQSFPVIPPLEANSASRSNRLEVTVGGATPCRSGGYWLATGSGVYRWDRGQLSKRLPPVPINEKEPFLLTEDGQGHLWAGRWGVGVYRWDESGFWQHFGAGTGLADNNVNCLLRDREGSLWIGTGQGGLHRFRPHLFHMYDTESGAGTNVVMSVTQDRQGRMWFGINGGGLHQWADGILRPVVEPALVRSRPLVYSVLADRQEAIWVGLYGNQVLRVHGGVATSHNLGDGLQPMTPQALFEDRAGIIWLGCAHSLIRFEDGAFTRHTVRDGLSSEQVAALAEDRSGCLYVGTDGGGLNCLREGRFSCYTERDGLADNHLSSLLVDAEDTLWIGTVNGGLSRLREGRFATVSVQEGLPSNTIGTLLEDDPGNLWLGTNRGIVRVNRAALNDYLDGKRQTVPWHVFGVADGLSTISCTGGGQPASCKAQDGKLWFSTTKGVAVVDPRHLPFNPLPPPVVIEEVALDDRVSDLQSVEFTRGAPTRTPLEALPADQASLLTIPPRTHRIEFRFTGLSLLAAEKVRFRYRLEPFDQDWIQAGSRRVAYYTRLPPGRYQFQVTACNNDGVWNEEGTHLGLVVVPSWWMTWWFRTLAVIALGGLVFGWYERRLHRLRHERLAQESFSRRLIALQENERRRIAGELHDGMGQDMLVIASQAQLSLSQNGNPPATAARLKDIADTAKQALQQARRMAHNLRPGLLDELGLSKAVRATLSKAAQAAGLVLAVEVGDVDGLLPPEFEVNLFRIVQESLSNVLKHAQASEAKVTLHKQSAGLRLIVEDNGCGFDADRMQSAPPEQMGFGLRQMAERAKMMGGRIDIKSQPGQGTRLTVEVPLSRATPPPG